MSTVGLSKCPPPSGLGPDDGQVFERASVEGWLKAFSRAIVWVSEAVHTTRTSPTRSATSILNQHCRSQSPPDFVRPFLSHRLCEMMLFHSCQIQV